VHETTEVIEETLADDNARCSLQVLQKQVEQLEQQLSMAVVMERKLQSELADVQAAWEKDQAEAAHEVSHSGLKYKQRHA
jgi:hypothetical protein